MPSLPDFSLENSLWKKGIKIIGGLDEVGRGSFAGPVVAAVVIFKENQEIEKEIVINDSKKLNPREREIASIWIKRNALSWGIGEGSVNKINKLGIKKATDIAFRNAIKMAKKNRIEHILIDAFYIPYVKGLKRKNQSAIIKGDTKSISIAAASIIAKVYRDKLMLNLSKYPKYKKYKWDKKKGYGTRKHRESIKRYGATNLHRTLFFSSSLK